MWHFTATLYISTNASSHWDIGKFPSSTLHVSNNVRTGPLFGTAPEDWYLPMGVYRACCMVTNHGPYSRHTEYRYPPNAILTSEKCFGNYSWSWKLAL